MILADKIINERKKNGWSQEELAEKLSVSRQSVSKWEGAQAIPDIKKIIMMAEIFNVSTDYLLKDEMEPADLLDMQIPEDKEVSSVRKVSMEEANDYLTAVKDTINKYTNAIFLCIISPVILIFLAGLSDDKIVGISEELAAGVGVVSLLVIVIVAVYMFLSVSSRLKKYDYLETEEIDTEYGVIGMVKDKKSSFEAEYTRKNSIGVILCIASVLPLIMTSLMEAPDYVIVSMVCVLLVVVAIGVRFIVNANTIMNSYQKLLQENEYTVKSKKQNERNSSLSGAYWLVATGIYLAWSFLTNDWEMTWVVWPVAGVLYGAFACVIRYFNYDK